MFQIRPIKEDDIGPMSQLYGEVFCENPLYGFIFQFKDDRDKTVEALTWLFSRRLQLLMRTNNPMFVAEEDGVFVGGIGCILRERRYSMIDMLAVGLLLWPFRYGFASVFRALDLDKKVEECSLQILPDSEGEIVMVAVNSSRHRQGIGRKLLSHALNDDRIKNLSLTLSTQKLMNISFYENVGGFGETRETELFGIQSWSMCRRKPTQQ